MTDELKEADAIREEVECIVAGRVGKEKAHAWMHTSNPLLGGAAPSVMIDRGRGAKLLRLVNALADGEGP